MKNVIYCFVVLLASNTSNRMFIGDIEAKRYIGSEGIEMIRNRGFDKGNIITSKNIDAPMLKVKEKSTAQNNELLSHDPKLKITKTNQQLRDKERLAILKQEMVSEVEASKIKRKVLQSHSEKNTLSEQEVNKLRKSLDEHEKNIRLLHSEINRTYLNL